MVYQIYQSLCFSTFSPVKSPATEFRFKFTEPAVRDNAVQIKERLLAWCRSKTKEYEVSPSCKWSFSSSHARANVIYRIYSRERG